MTEIEKYLQAIDLANIEFDFEKERFETWGDRIEIYLNGKPFPKIDNNVNMAIIGVPEDRASVNNKG